MQASQILMFHKISYPFLENLSNIQILCYSKQFHVEIFRIIIQIITNILIGFWTSIESDIFWIFANQLFIAYLKVTDLTQKF